VGDSTPPLPSSLPPVFFPFPHFYGGYAVSGLLPIFFRMSFGLALDPQLSKSWSFHCPIFFLSFGSVVVFRLAVLPHQIIQAPHHHPTHRPSPSPFLLFGTVYHLLRTLNFLWLYRDPGSSKVTAAALPPFSPIAPLPQSRSRVLFMRQLCRKNRGPHRVMLGLIPSTFFTFFALILVFPPSSWTPLDRHLVRFCGLPQAP